MYSSTDLKVAVKCFVVKIPSHRAPEWKATQIQCFRVKLDAQPDVNVIKAWVWESTNRLSICQLLAVPEKEEDTTKEDSGWNVLRRQYPEVGFAPECFVLGQLSAQNVSSWDNPPTETITDSASTSISPSALWFVVSGEWKE